MCDKISVIVPVHNTEQFIRECIVSILGQTYGRIEVICVDSSTDNTSSIIQECTLRDPRIVHVKDGNRSYGYKVNQGIRKAKGDYIAIVDADDYIESDMLENLYRTVIEYQVDFVKSDHTGFCVEQGQNIFQKHISDGYRPYFYGQVFSIKKYPEIICLSNPAIWTGLYRKDFLLKNNIFLHESEGASYQDAGFSVLTHIMAERIFYLNQSYYRYRLDNQNSSVKSQNKYRAVVEECSWIEEQLRKRGVDQLEIWDAVRIRKINTYFWNYERLNSEGRKLFCKEIQQELEDNFDENSIEHWRTITKERLKILISGGQ